MAEALRHMESQQGPGHSLTPSHEFQHEVELSVEVSIYHGQGRVQLARRFSKASREKRMPRLS